MLSKNKGEDTKGESRRPRREEEEGASSPLPPSMKSYLPGRGHFELSVPGQGFVFAEDYQRRRRSPHLRREVATGTAKQAETATVVAAVKPGARRRRPSISTYHLYAPAKSQCGGTVG